jgi:ElaB/YqjD/DUF883 family membrane-anchored ribosome-binding protein
MSNVANPSRPRNEENTTGKMAAAVSDQVEQASSFVAEKANEAGKYVSDACKSAASSAVHSCENAASYMGDRAGDARSAVGDSIKSAASSIRSAAPQEQGTMHDAACSFADSLENTGRYIQDHDFAAMGEDVTNVIRRNPIPAVLIAAGVGFLLARACTSSRSSY